MSGIIESADRSDVNESNYVSGTLSVGTTAVEVKVGSSRLERRQFISVHNYGPATIFIGPSGVTTSSGRPIFRDQSIDMPVGNLPIYVIASSAGQTVIVQELS